MKYKIIKASEGIYWAKFDNAYDMCLTFCRYQEFYESPNSNFRGKAFTLLDYQEWYAKEHNGSFTYPIDWIGFNLPGSIIDEVIALGIPDPNKYDLTMAEINKKIKALAWQDYQDIYYLIGSCGEELDPHEFAHGYFFIDQEYRDQMTALVRQMDNKAYDRLCNWLLEIGYTEKVFDDEIQAYLATSHPFCIKGEKKRGVNWQKVAAPFQEAYRKHNQEVPLLAEYWRELQ